MKIQPYNFQLQTASSDVIPPVSKSIHTEEKEKARLFWGSEAIFLSTVGNETVITFFILAFLSYAADISARWQGNRDHLNDAFQERLVAVLDQVEAVGLGPGVAHGNPVHQGRVEPHQPVGCTHSLTGRMVTYANIW
jgi:hypothetical protein